MVLKKLHKVNHVYGIITILKLKVYIGLCQTNGKILKNRNIMSVTKNKLLYICSLNMSSD